MQHPDHHDGAWKEVIELYFPQMLALLAPDLHALIDWTVPVEFMDRELQAVLRAIRTKPPRWRLCWT